MGVKNMCCHNPSLVRGANNLITAYVNILNNTIIHALFDGIDRFGMNKLFIFEIMAAKPKTQVSRTCLVIIASQPSNDVLCLFRMLESIIIKQNKLYPHIYIGWPQMTRINKLFLHLCQKRYQK
jgi:hypothetical protein